MQITKKINNNVAEAIDGNGKKIVVFGKGIGFPKMPYELTDLSLIMMTYYQVDDYFFNILSDLPEPVLNAAFGIVKLVEQQLDGVFNQSLVFSLADHINFAISRQKEMKNVKLKFSTDVASHYPKETGIGNAALEIIKQQTGIKLPDSETTAIALNIINSRFESQLTSSEQQIEKILDNITRLIEIELSIKINRNEFNYSRFRNHLEFYFNRLRNGEQFVDGNLQMLALLKESKGPIYETTEKITKLIESKIDVDINADELLYLMIHVNRLYEKNNY